LIFRITTWPERAAPPDVAYGAAVIGGAFLEGDLHQSGDRPAAPDQWRWRWVARDGVRVHVRIRSEIAERVGDRVFDQLADAAGPARLAGSAIFVDITGTREPMPIGREYFLRRFAALSDTEQVDFVFHWGPLDLADQPNDLWFTSLSSRRGSHLDAVDDLLNATKRRHPDDGLSFPVGRAGAEIKVEGFAIEVQDLAFRVYQAAVATLIELVLRDRPDSLRHGFAEADLDLAPPRAVVDAWRQRDLPAPRTVAQVLDTTLGVLLRGTAGSAPHVEVRPEKDAGNRFWQLGRGILGAISLQAVHAVSDVVPVRPCARCGQLFQRQDEAGPSERSQGTTRVTYCSDRCARAQAQQRYRERKRRAASGQP
jgi:hypothetical protein